MVQKCSPAFTNACITCMAPIHEMYSNVKNKISLQILYSGYVCKNKCRLCRSSPADNGAEPTAFINKYIYVLSASECEESRSLYQNKLNMIINYCIQINSGESQIYCKDIVAASKKFMMPIEYSFTLDNNMYTVSLVDSIVYEVVKDEGMFPISVIFS